MKKKHSALLYCLLFPATTQLAADPVCRVGHGRPALLFGLLNLLIDGPQTFPKTCLKLVIVGGHGLRACPFRRCPALVIQMR